MEDVNDAKIRACALEQAVAYYSRLTENKYYSGNGGYGFAYAKDVSDETVVATARRFEMYIRGER